MEQSGPDTDRPDGTPESGSAWQYLFPWVLILLAALCAFSDALIIAIALSAGAIVAAIQTASARGRFSREG
ncbi:hypothetical protein [Gordonia phthalatica]|uniref:Uncharacterized protein n=1 Tax=Gordonia phthalatica TaxID=1136941 RepID=A0A0N9N2X5_9ACTN|nr:hypothetical protein [Gordonia phthalatica]ALG85018.1 hypothetical protein ACH46_11635 [Gordonia phthalatica]